MHGAFRVHSANGGSSLLLSSHSFRTLRSCSLRRRRESSSCHKLSRPKKLRLPRFAALGSSIKKPHGSIFLEEVGEKGASHASGAGTSSTMFFSPWRDE